MQVHPLVGEETILATTNAVVEKHEAQLKLQPEDRNQLKVIAQSTMEE